MAQCTEPFNVPVVKRPVVDDPPPEKRPMRDEPEPKTKKRPVTDTLADAALSYARRGWKVYPVQPVTNGHCGCGDPLCAKPGKHPLSLLARHGYNDATDDESQIALWWDQQPDANVGLRTGVESGVYALDVDAKNGGLETLEKLIAEHGPLPDTPRSRTGGGGLHIFFKPSSALATRTIAPGVEIKAERGSVNLPPSRHASGNLYTWEQTGPLAEMPEWLIDLTKPREVIDAGREIAFIHEGERRNHLASLAGSLRRRGYNRELLQVMLLTANQHVCKPPLPDREVKDLARSYARKAINPKEKTNG